MCTSWRAASRQGGHWCGCSVRRRRRRSRFLAWKDVDVQHGQNGANPHERQDRHQPTRQAFPRSGLRRLRIGGAAEHRSSGHLSSGGLRRRRCGRRRSIRRRSIHRGRGRRRSGWSSSKRGSRPGQSRRGGRRRRRRWWCLINRRLRRCLVGGRWRRRLINRWRRGLGLQGILPLRLHLPAIRTVAIGWRNFSPAFWANPREHVLLLYPIQVDF